MLFAKHFPLLPVSGLLFVVSLSPWAQADEVSPSGVPGRAALTQAAFELQRDILLMQQTHLNEESRGLAIYLDVDNLLQARLDGITVSLGDQLLVDETFSDAQLKQLAAGGMKKLHIGYLAPGDYQLKTTVKSGTTQTSKSLNLKKTDGRDNLKIGVTSFMQQRSPEITFTQESWATQ